MYEKCNRYTYSGSVESFGRCIANCWKGETMAPTKQKALSNLTYQAKKILKLNAGTRITLPGEVKMK